VIRQHWMARRRPAISKQYIHTYPTLSEFECPSSPRGSLTCGQLCAINSLLGLLIEFSLAFSCIGLCARLCNRDSCGRLNEWNSVCTSSLNVLAFSNIYNHNKVCCLIIRYYWKSINLYMQKKYNIIPNREEYYTMHINLTTSSLDYYIYQFNI